MSIRPLSPNLYHVQVRSDFQSSVLVLTLKTIEIGCGDADSHFKYSIS
jgi:hypothetical protein